MNTSRMSFGETSESSSDLNTTSQHYLSPKLSNLFLIIDFTLLLQISYSHYMIKCMIRREKEKKGHAIIKSLLSCYAIIVPCVFIFCFTYVHVILRYASPPAQVLGHGFCYVYAIFAHSGGLYVGAFSLFTALIKYWFIVNNAHAKGVGEEKAKNVFAISYCIIPLVLAAFNAISTGNVDQVIWVNYCWRPLPSFDTMNSSQHESKNDLFCADRQYDIEKYFGTTASNHFIPMLRLICGGVKLSYIVFFSNTAELAIYALIFKYLNR